MHRQVGAPRQSVLTFKEEVEASDQLVLVIKGVGAPRQSVLTILRSCGFLPVGAGSSGCWCIL